MRFHPVRNFSSWWKHDVRALQDHNKIIISSYTLRVTRHFVPRASLSKALPRARTKCFSYSPTVYSTMQINLPRGTFPDLDKTSTLYKSHEIIQRSMQRRRVIFGKFELSLTFCVQHFYVGVKIFKLLLLLLLLLLLFFIQLLEMLTSEIRIQKVFSKNNFYISLIRDFLIIFVLFLY